MSDWNPPGQPPQFPPPTASQPAVPPGGPAGGPPPGAPPPGSPSGAPPPHGQGRTVAIAVAATLAAVALIGGAFFLGRSGGDDDATTSTTTQSTTSSTTSTTTAPESSTTVDTTVPPPPAVGDVRSLPDGLFCRDLEAQGYSYSAAVDYWRVHGQPNRMDEDRNGIPCETVFPRSDVVAYWPASTYQAIPSYGLPSGLLCRDLEARGIDVYGALTYFIWEGSPARMDADGNGIPCETVYPDATEVWLFEF